MKIRIGKKEIIHFIGIGKMQLVDTAGRIDKFKNRYSKQKK